MADEGKKPAEKEETEEEEIIELSESGQSTSSNMSSDPQIDDTTIKSTLKRLGMDGLNIPRRPRSPTLCRSRSFSFGIDNAELVEEIQRHSLLRRLYSANMRAPHPELEAEEVKNKETGEEEKTIEQDDREKEGNEEMIEDKETGEGKTCGINVQKPSEGKKVRRCTVL